MNNKKLIVDKNKALKYFLAYIFVLVSSLCTVILYLKYFPVNSKVITEEKTINETKLTESSIEDAIESVFDSVVTVEAYNQGQTIGTGSGFVYKVDDNKGYILTNHHVINGSSTIDVILSNDEVVNVKLLGSDEYSDLAVLEIDKKQVIKTAKLGNSDNIKLGGTIITVGSPMGSDYSGSITRGIISGKDRTIESSDVITKVIQIDAAINPGNSGGPLVNLAGEVIGITSMKLAQEEIEGMGFAIPINDAKNYVEYLEQGKEIERPSMGVSVINVSDRFSLYRYNIDVPSSIKSGVVLAEVVNGSSASKAGLKVGDVVTKLDDNKITSSSEIRYYLYQHKIGDKIKVTYYRDGKENTLDMELLKSK